MAHSVKKEKGSPAKLRKAVAKAILKQMSKKKTTLCKDVIKVVCRSPKYDEEEVVNTIKGLCNSGYARLGKSSWEKYRKLENRKIVLLKYPCDSDTDSDTNSSDDNE